MVKDFLTTDLPIAQYFSCSYLRYPTSPPFFSLLCRAKKRPAKQIIAVEEKSIHTLSEQKRSTRSSPLEDCRQITLHVMFPPLPPLRRRKNSFLAVYPNLRKSCCIKSTYKTLNSTHKNQNPLFFIKKSVFSNTLQCMYYVHCLHATKRL